MKSYDDAAEFHRFFEENHRMLARLAYLLVGDTEAADDLTADAFVATWRRWDRAQAAGEPVVAVRRNVIDLAARRGRSLARERGASGLMRAEVREGPHEPDVPSVPGVRVALRRLSPRRRACAALRCAFDIPEDQVASALGVSVGTAKKETARAIAAFEKAVNARRSPRARAVGRAPSGARALAGPHAANGDHPANGHPAGEDGGTGKGRRAGRRGRAAQPPDWLRFALYREAYAHEPDRARMRARVAAALRARVTRRARIRMAAAGGTAVAIAVIAMIALPRITGSNTPLPSDPAGSSPVNPAIPQPNGSAVVMPRPGRPAMKVSSRVDGRTGDYWSQNLVDVTSDRPLTGLRVTLRVARTRGARATGSWLSLSPDDFDITSGHDGRSLVYRWTLKPGRTVPAGTYTFAGQYEHRPGRRDPGKDAFTVTASGGAGGPVDATGHF